VYANNAEKSATISGNVCLERCNLKITAETSIYNWQTKIAVFKNNVVVEKDGASSSSNELNYNFTTNSIL
ncbi:MAG: organic solvent tolerance protein OstA, partial [Negativicutes bacterium]|nr:organic solvent tolerance protein OstA [Negativicutes bacterium]